MDLTYMQTFREVAFHRSFTKAAEELGYAQSSVTMQMQKLEQAYGVKLFERYGRKLRLTSAGEGLLPLFIQMLDLYQQSKEITTLHGSGTLTVGTIDSLASYYLPAFIEQLRQKFPSLTIRLLPDSESAIAQNVKDGELDVGLLLEGKPSDPSLQWLKIKEEPLVLLANPQHPYAAYDSVGLDQLRDAEWIMTEESCNYRIMLEKALRSQGIPYRVGLELGNPEAIKRCVKAGSGISLLPRMAVEEEISRGELAVLPFTHPDIRLDLYMVIHPKKWISSSLQAFMDMLRNGAVSSLYPGRIIG